MRIKDIAKLCCGFSLIFISLFSCKKESYTGFIDKISEAPFEETWPEFEKEVNAKLANANFKFGSPATLRDVSNWEKTFSQTMPKELLKLYEMGNGQAEDGDSFMRGYLLISISNAIRIWQVTNQKIASIPIPQEVKGFVKNTVWHNDWIPFASDSAGNLICLDMAPESGGTKGQLIIVNFETGSREVLSPSFLQYLAKTTEGLKNGELHFDQFRTGPMPKN